MFRFRLCALASFAVTCSSNYVMPIRDGESIPSVGLGVYMIRPGEETYNSVKWALELGYRMIDTAQLYRNEADVGRAVRDSGIKREELWVQSKLEMQHHGYEATIKAVMRTLEVMGLTYLDCFLVHSPDGGKLVETWDALLKLQASGHLRSIGVSNYDIRHIEALESHGRPLPVINQIEMHPLIRAERQKLIDWCENKGIVIQAYGSLFFGKTEYLSDEKVVSVVNNHPGKTAAQVLLRWGFQKHFQLIPKSVKKHRLEENFNIFDFELTEDDMATLDSMSGSLGAYWNPVANAEVDLGDTHSYKSVPSAEL